MSSLQLAQQFAAQGKIEEAMNAYGQLVSAHPDHPQIYTLYAEFLLDNGFEQRAEPLLARVLEIKPRAANALAVMGRLCARQGKLEEAEKYFSKALKLEPKNAVLHHVYGHVLMENKRYEEAEKKYNRALQLNPELAMAYFHQGVMYNTLGDYTKAVPALKKAIQLMPLFGEPYLILSMYYLNYNQAEIFDAFYSESINRQLDKNTCAVLAVAKALFNYMYRPDPQDVALLKNNPVEDKAFQGKRVFQNFRVFAAYLCKLYKEREKEPHLLNRQEEHGDKKEIYCVGDSHALAPAHIMVAGKCSITSRLVMGVKAFHLARDNKLFTGALAAQFAELPEGSQVVMHVGEIDCRVEEGFLPFFIKNPEVDRTEFITQTVCGYVDHVLAAAAEKNFHLAFINVPAPRIDNILTPPDEEQQRLQIILDFNEALAQKCAEHNLPCFDVYAVTKGEKGFASGHGHLDKAHVRPALYQPFFESLFT